MKSSNSKFMLKSIFLHTIFIVAAFFILTTTSNVTFATTKVTTLAQTSANPGQRTIEIKQTKVEYDLPFPGILPDNPLYVFKETRDTLKLFLTRDYSEKADLLLLYSDKHAAVAQTIANKNDWSEAASLMVKSEEVFEKMIESMRKSQEQGASPESGFLKQAVLSNAKHQEIIVELMAMSPQGTREVLENVLKKNAELGKSVKNFIK